MELTAQVMMLIIIAGSACCVLTGVIVAAVRIARFTRREHMLRNEILTALQFQELDSIQPKGCKETSKSGDNNTP